MGRSRTTLAFTTLHDEMRHTHRAREQQEDFSKQTEIKSVF